MADEFEVGVTIVGDDSQITEAASGAATAVEEMSTSLEQSTTAAGKSLEGLGSDAGSAADSVSTAADDAGSAITDLAETADGSFTDLGDAAETGAKAVSDAAGSAGSAADQLSTDTTDALTDSQTAFEEFATAVGGVADDIGTSIADTSASVTEAFSSSGTVPAAVDQGAISLTTKVGKFKAVGSTLGSTLAQGVSSGIDGPQAALNVGSSVSGLLALSAKTVTGTVAGVGIGLGFALIGGVINAIQKNSAEAKAAFEKSVATWTQAYIDGLGEIDKATRRMKLEEAIQDTDSAWSKATGAVKEFKANYDESLGGIGENTITNALFGTPEEQAEAAKKVNDARNAAQKAYEIGVNSKELSQQEKSALGDKVNKLNDIVEIVGAENEALNKAKDNYNTLEKQAGRLGLRTKEEKQARQEVNQAADEYNAALQTSINRVADLAKNSKDYAGTTSSAADDAQRYANALERANRAAERLSLHDNNRWNGVA